MKTCLVFRRVVRRTFSFVLIPLMNAGLMAAPPAGWRTDPTPAVSATEFLAYSGVNVHFNYFSYGWSIGGVPPAWANKPGYNHSGFSSAWGSQKWREWLNLCAVNNIKGIRIMSPFGDGRNLFDTAGNISIDEALFRADLDAFLRIVEEVETQRNVKFRLIFTLFDFRIADGEWIDGVGEHPDILDPANPKRAQFLNLFRDKFFKMVYDSAQPYAQWGLVRENRIVWQLVNEFISMKPDTGGRSELQAMDDLAYRDRREALYVQGESFFLAFRDMIKNIRPTALVSMSDLGAENTIRRWQNKGFDLLDYHSHPDYLHLNGNIGATLKNVGWNGVQPIIEAEAYVPGWRWMEKSVLTERMRASFNRGSRGAMFWWDGWYRFDPSLYSLVTTEDLAFSPKADLIVEGVTGPNRAVENQPISFAVTVGNWGPVSTGESYLKLQMNGSFFSGFNIPPLSPGQSYTAPAASTNVAVGYHRFLAEADNGLTYPELDEDNNNVAMPVVGILPGADLVVEKLEGTDSLVAGNTTVFETTIANRGSESAGESHLKFQIDGREIQTVVVRPLAPGETFVAQVNWSAVAGLHTLLIEADNWQRVAETNESNNDMSRILSVNAAPILYSRYLGGAGNSSILDAVTDAAGNTIVVGETSGGGHPVTSGSWDTTYNGGSLDAFVAKFSADGTLLFSTYLGGSGEDSALGVALDNAGNILVTGKTYSSNFPTTSGAYDRSLGGARDAFLAKMTSDGRSVVYGTYLGGAEWDYGHRVTVAPGGDMIVTGFTHGGYPVTTGAAQTVFGGAGDVFVTRLKAAGNGVVYSTYLGGESWDGAGGLAVDALGQVILSGDTHSRTFPTTVGAWDRTCDNCGTNTSTDGFLAKLSAKGDRWVFSTFVGGSAAPSTESLRRIAVASDGSIWAVGTSNGGDFPVTPDAAQFQLAGGADAVIVRFSGDGSQLFYGSYIGGTGRDVAMDVKTDGEGGVVLTGITESLNFPVTSGAVQKERRGTADAFVVKLKPGLGITFSTYWGGTGPELDGLALTKDGIGRLVLAGGTGSPDLPLMGGANGGYGGGASDGFVTAFNGLAFPDEPPPPVNPESILYSQYFGGTGNSTILGAVSDAAGNIIVVGETTGDGHPATSGSFDTTYNGGSLDAFVAKFSMNGTLLFSTYLGGSGEDSALGVALDSAGNILVTGKTYSTNFPTTSGAYDRTLGGERDAFLVKLSSGGQSLKMGTYLGGPRWDYGHRVTVAIGGDVIVTGFTHGEYPVTTGAAQAVFGGAGDVFVTRLKAAGNAVVYSTYIGGESWDGAGGLAVDSLGQVYLSGDTHSTLFPTTLGAYDRTCTNCSTNLSTDGYIAKLSAAGDRWIYSTFIGGGASPASESLRRLAVGWDGTVTAVGTSEAADFPVTPDAAQSQSRGGAEAVVVKLSSDGSTLLYGSFLGGGGRDAAMDVVSDGEGGMVVAGVTDSSNFPVTSNAAQGARRGSTDAFVVKMKPGLGVLYGTYWGGTGPELDGMGLAKDGAGRVVLAGGTGSTNIPTFGGPTPGGYGGGSSDGTLVSFKGLAVADVVPPPNKPSGTQLVMREGRVVLTWTANGNFPGTTYQVYASTNKLSYQWKVTTLNLEMTPELITGVTHYFKVRAQNIAKVVSAFDVVVSTRISAALPAASSALSTGRTEPLSRDIPWFNVGFATEQDADVSILLDPVEEARNLFSMGEMVGHPWLVSVDGKGAVPVQVSAVFADTAHRYTVVRWDESGSIWEDVPPGEAAPPGLFALRRAIPPSVSAAKIYPNPFRPARGHTEVKMEVPLGSTVRLYTLTGELVRELSPDSQGVILWRGDNGAGQSVASGVYFCFIEKDGDKKIFRLAVEQ